MKKIAEHYIQKIIPSSVFLSKNPVKDSSLLFPEFRGKLQKSIDEYTVKYPGTIPVIVESYRSQSLQLQYYNSGASKIKTNGMHHYGIAVDIGFMVNGKFTYNGDYKYLRSLHTKNGLFLLGLWDAGHVQFIPATATDQNSLRNTVNQAVRKFQAENNLSVDGIIGKYTIAKAKEKFN